MDNIYLKKNHLKLGDDRELCKMLFNSFIQGSCLMTNDMTNKRIYLEFPLSTDVFSNTDMYSQFISALHIINRN